MNLGYINKKGIVKCIFLDVCLIIGSNPIYANNIFLIKNCYLYQKI